MLQSAVSFCVCVSVRERDRLSWRQPFCTLQHEDAVGGEPIINCPATDTTSGCWKSSCTLTTRHDACCLHLCWCLCTSAPRPLSHKYKQRQWKIIYFKLYHMDWCKSTLCMEKMGVVSTWIPHPFVHSIQTAAPGLVLFSMNELLNGQSSQIKFSSEISWF